MRAAPAAMLLLALAVATAAAGDPPPAPPAAPVTDAEWDARDGEGRWVLYRAATGSEGSEASRASEEAWVAFAKARKDWEFLEWVSLTSRTGHVVAALADAKAPNWARCARWALLARDSHKRGAAQALLDKAGETSDGEPRWDPEVVLADLVPPPELAEWGAALRAEPGKRYVHQVVRAIDVLLESTLAGDPWAGRLAALIVHPHADVRRAACLAYGARPPKEIPLDALTARVDDTAETVEVRAAAVLGLSYSKHPSAYATLLRIGTAPAHPGWRAAVSRLGDLDDGFAPVAWKDVDVTPAGEGAEAFRDEQAARIAKRAAALDDAAFSDRIVPLLERAAWMDLSCGPFEGPLVTWTLAAVRARAGQPVVRSALEKARDAYESPHAGGDLMGPLEPRVRDYARSVVDGEAEADGASARDR